MPLRHELEPQSPEKQPVQVPEAEAQPMAEIKVGPGEANKEKQYAGDVAQAIAESAVESSGNTRFEATVAGAGGKLASIALNNPSQAISETDDHRLVGGPLEGEIPPQEQAA